MGIDFVSLSSGLCVGNDSVFYWFGSLSGETLNLSNF